MGFRFRKSKKIGSVRLNLSSSGVGWSIGGKRFRYTQPSKGKAYTTTTIPGSGISYRQTVQTSGMAEQPEQSAPQTQRDTGCLIPVLIGLLIGVIILGIMYFIRTLPGYTRENVIPDPPDRSVLSTQTLPVSQDRNDETEPQFDSEIETLHADAPSETLSAETVPPKTVPAETTPETTLDEWLAAVEARVNRRGDETDSDTDETTFDEWLAHLDRMEETAKYTKTYIINTSTKKIHEPGCSEISKMNTDNMDFTDSPAALISSGYSWCQKCHD